MGNTSSMEVVSNLSGNCKARAGWEDNTMLSTENYFKARKTGKCKYHIAQNNPTMHEKTDPKHWNPEDGTPSMLNFLLPHHKQHNDVNATCSNDLVSVSIMERPNISANICSSKLATRGSPPPTATDATSLVQVASQSPVKHTFTKERAILKTVKVPSDIKGLFSSQAKFDQGDANALLKKECDKLEYLWRPQVKPSEASTNLQARFNNTKGVKSENGRVSKSKSKFTFSAAFRKLTKSEPKVIQGQRTTFVCNASTVDGVGQGELQEQDVVVVPLGVSAKNEAVSGSSKSIKAKKLNPGSRATKSGDQQFYPGQSVNEYVANGDVFQNQQYSTHTALTPVTVSSFQNSTTKKANSRPKSRLPDKTSSNKLHILANDSHVGNSSSKNTPQHSVTESSNTFSNSGSGEKTLPKRGPSKKKPPPPPPVYISSSYGSGSGTKTKTTADRLKNVDIVEELTYCAPGEACAGYDCSSTCCDTYCCCNDCGECRLVPQCCEYNPCSCPASNPIKYCRRQRFNFEDESRKQDEDAPPYCWECRKNPYDDIPCGKNPKPGDYKPSRKPENPCDDVFPAESGTYFFDACRGTFIPVEEIKTDGDMPPEIIDEIIEEEPVLTNIEPIMQPVMNPCCGPCEQSGTCGPYGPCGGPGPCPPSMPFCGIVGPCKESEFRQDSGSLAMQGLCGANMPGLAAMGPYGAIAMPQYQYQPPPEPPQQPNNPYPPCMPMPPSCPCPPFQPHCFGPMCYPGYPDFPGYGMGKKKKKNKIKSKKRKSAVPISEPKEERALDQEEDEHSGELSLHHS